MVQISRNVAANIRHTVAVQTIRHRPVATTTKVAHVISTKMVVVPTKSHQRKDRNSKDAAANTINSDVAPTALRLPKDPMAMAAIARNANTNAAPMALRRRLDPISTDVLAPQANTAAVPMASPTHKEHTSMDAKKFQLHRKKLAVSPKTAAPAAITQSNTSTIWNMVVAHDSGTAAAAATAIVTNQSKSAKQRAKRLPARTHANCQRSMDHAQVTIQSITTIQIAMLAHNSFMADAWATQIVSKPSKSARKRAKSTNLCVS